MSYANTFILPRDPDFIPTDDQVAQGSAMLDQILRGHYGPPGVHRHTTPRLYSVGESWTSFTCPRCGQSVRCDRREEALLDWWYTKLYGLREPDQRLTVPCCGAQIAGKEFDFGEDAVFSRFALEIEDLHLLDSGYLKPGDLQALEDALGFPIRVMVEQGT